MDVQEKAQALIDRMQKELTKTEENVTLLKGAIQGVNLLYTELTQIESADEQNPQPEPPAQAAGPKKAKK